VKLAADLLLKRPFMGSVYVQLVLSMQRNKRDYSLSLEQRCVQRQRV